MEERVVFFYGWIGFVLKQLEHKYNALVRVVSYNVYSIRYALKTMTNLCRRRGIVTLRGRFVYAI